MKLIRVLVRIILVFLHSKFSELFVSASDSLQNTFSIAKYFSTINYDALTCINYILFPKYLINQRISRNLEIIDLQVFPVVLIGIEASGEDDQVIVNAVNEINRRLPSEGCRILVDLSDQRFGHVSPSDLNKQAMRVFTYEIEFHHRAEPNLTSFIKDYTHNMDNTVSPYVRTLLVAIQSVSYFVSCISCEPRCTLISSNHQNISSPSDIRRHCLLTSHGQRLFAYVKSDSSVRERIREPQPECELITAHFIGGRRCIYAEIMVRLIATRLNVSYEVDNSVFTELPLIEDFADDELPGEIDPNPGLIMCVEFCKMDESNYLGGRVVGSFLYDDKTYGMYCNAEHSSKDPTWLEIFDLCDVYTWIGIIASALAAGAISWNIRYSLDVIFILLGQQQQCNWRREGKDILLGTFILSMTILNQDYLSYLTNQVTAPLQNYKILNVQELFGSGYRLPAKNNEVFMLYNFFLEERYIALNMGNKTIYDYAAISEEMDISDGIMPFWFRIMSKEKFILPTPWKSLQLFQQLNIFKQNRIHNYSCYIVKSDDKDDDQYLFKREYWFLFRGRMKDKAYWLIQRLHHAAIYDYWRAEGIRADLRASRVKNHCWANPEICNDNTFFQPLKWNSRFKIVLYWHIAICAAAYIAFLMEKMLASKNSTRVVAKTDEYDIIMSKLGAINAATISILGLNSFAGIHKK